MTNVNPRRPYVWIDGGFTPSEIARARDPERRPHVVTVEEYRARESSRCEREYRGQAVRPAVAHGTRSRYAGGCRCDPCRAAESEYQKERWRNDPGRHRRRRRAA